MLFALIGKHWNLHNESGRKLLNSLQGLSSGSHQATLINDKIDLCGRRKHKIIKNITWLKYQSYDVVFLLCRVIWCDT